MKRQHGLGIVALGLGLAVARLISAGEPGSASLPECEEGCTIVEETCYREVVVSSACRLVPDTKTVKKTVYSYKDIPYCRHACPNPLTRWGSAEPCTECDCKPRTRRVLLKREIVEKQPVFKCVVEQQKELRPYTVFRCVPR